MSALLSASVLYGSKSKSRRSPLGPVTVAVSLPACQQNSTQHTVNTFYLLNYIIFILCFNYHDL